MAILNTLPYTESTEAATEREQLIMQHLPQVRWIAMRLHERLPGSTTLEDLVSIGVIGLINAVDNFNPAFNVKLATYAEHKIRGAILDSIRGMDGIPAHKRKHLKEIQSAMSALEQRLERTPTEEEIAVELGTDLKTYQERLVEVRGVTIGSLDAASSQDDSRTWLSFIAEPEENSPVRILERSELQRLVTEGVKKMPHVESTVLDLYYRQELGIREIASILGIHITRVSQLKSQAVLRLRCYVQRHWPTSNGVY